jgi:hypothetical protein
MDVQLVLVPIRGRIMSIHVSIPRFSLEISNVTVEMQLNAIAKHGTTTVTVDRLKPAIVKMVEAIAMQNKLSMSNAVPRIATRNLPQSLQHLLPHLLQLLPPLLLNFLLPGEQELTQLPAFLHWKLS